MSTAIQVSRSDIIGLCRLCLAKDLAEIDIFETGSEYRQLFTKIVTCLPVEVTQNEDLPTRICEVCNSKVDNFYQFWTSTAKNQKQLQEWLKTATDEIKKTDITTIKVEADDPRGEDYEPEDYDDDHRGDSYDEEEDAPSAPKRIKIQHSSDIEEDTKPSKLVLDSASNGASTSKTKKSTKETSRDSTGRRNARESDQFEDHSTCIKPNKKKLAIKTPRFPRKSNFMCALCDATYSRKSLLETHIGKHMGLKLFACDICPKQYSRDHTLRQHKLKEHNPARHDDPKTVSFCPKPRACNFECAMCGALYSRKALLEAHIGNHMGVKLFTCDICHKEYSREQTLQAHLKKDHKKGPPEEFKCDECGKLFLENRGLRRHKSWAHGDKCHVCKVCGAKIKGSLKQHMITHSGERRFCCHICGKKLRNKLKEHMLTHTGERPYACEICGGTFKNNWYLGVHMRKHSKEKPYVCDFCGQSFAARPAYTTHLKKHTEKASFECQICRHRFYTETDLATHFTEHFGVSTAS